MKAEKREVVVIGGGPAGLAAAVAAKREGAKDVLVIERDRVLGGILNQCIHDGFGLHVFKEALSGPEYAARYIDKVAEAGVDVMTDTIVLNLNAKRELEYSSRGRYGVIQAGAVILAMGCRERTRGGFSIPGTRPAGVYTAGSAQAMMNLENIMPGKKVCIRGSGDIGLIMARRMALEGAEVVGVFAARPYASGLPRNIQQCLDDYGIPLRLSTAILNIHGHGRLSGITIADNDAGGRPVPGTEQFVACDTLLLSLGLLPENELSRGAGVTMDSRTNGALVDEHFMTSVPGIFSCGNVLHVHDLVDWVSDESDNAGSHAVRFLQGRPAGTPRVRIKPGEGIGYTMPQHVTGDEDFSVFMRVRSPMTDKAVVVKADGKEIQRRKHKRLQPAEMMRVDLKAESVRGVSGVEVCVE